MKTKKKLSLKWRIFAALSAIMLIILMLLWLFQTVFLNSFYQMVRVNETKTVSGAVSGILADEDAEVQIAALSNAHNVSIKVLDNTFATLYSAQSPEARNSFFNHIPDSEYYSFYQKAQENGGTYSEYFGGFSAEDAGADSQSDSETKRSAQTAFIIIKTVENPAGGNYTVIVNASITPVDSVITTLRVILIAVTAITLAGALIIAFVLSSSLTKPIKRISKKAKILATGDYSVEFEPSSIKEINELSDSLNYTKTELGKIDTLQKELIANISHDLRTPLTLIGGYAEVMRDIPGEVTDENLQVIIDETARLTSLVNDVLDISKLSSGAQQMQPEALDLIECVQSVIPRYNKLIESNHYKITFESGNLTRATVRADRTRLLQVIYNLVNNAVSYTGADKTVRITLCEEGDGYTMHVMDSGEGIPADKLPYIWDRYYKVDKSHRRAQIGSGLGLSIVKQILDAHGAAYGVNSTPGEGSDFWFHLKKENEA